MGRLTARLIRTFRAWDRASQIGLMTAATLLFITLLVGIFGPIDLRTPARVGVLGLLIVSQVIVMWANRHMVTPYTQAQRAYLDEDFQQARDLLEAERAGGKADVRELTLLGNTYRQLGELEASERILREALALRPNLHFPLYGFGRTLLVQGRYVEAIDVLRHALEAGAPTVVQFDLADACFRQGLWDEARAILQGVRLEEPYRALMAQYLLHQLNAGGQLTSQLIQTGLPYWLANAERFRQTPYGEALADDILRMQTLVEEV